jgi:hypothetical protein
MSKYQIYLKTSPMTTNRIRPEQMLWSRPGNMSAESDLEWLLKAMPAAEAALYRVLIQLIPAPSADAPNLARRQIKWKYSPS